MLLLNIGPTGIYLTLFTSVVFAAPQNVTVDDAVLTGAVVPDFIPPSAWSQGANCSVCVVKPDPAFAYNGTWHDTTFIPGNGAYQSIEITFVGSAVYTFFILANDIMGAATSTNVSVIMDGTPVYTYVHTPSSSPAFQYNVPVYSNTSMDFGQHTMVIEPVNTGNALLMLFDYLIYTVDTDLVTTTSTPLSASTYSSSPTSPATSKASSSQNVGAIVGGTIGGVAAALAATTLIFCYRRHKQHSVSAEANAIQPFFTLPPPVAQVRLNPSPVAHAPSLFKSPGSSITSDPPSVLSNSPSSSSNSPSTGQVAILEQVELLRGEVAQLRQLRGQEEDIIEQRYAAPPTYSESQ